MKTSQIHTYTVIYEKDKNGAFNVIVPALPEICTFGADMEEARLNAEEAIRLVIMSKIEEGEVVPLENLTEERLAVTV